MALCVFSLLLPLLPPAPVDCCCQPVELYLAWHAIRSAGTHVGRLKRAVLPHARAAAMPHVLHALPPTPT